MLDHSPLTTIHPVLTMILKTKKQKIRLDGELLSHAPAVERGRLSVAVTLAMAARIARMQERSLELVSF
ncbi:hypothetical protein MMC29_003788 [Sticta canariensis]|nr:hypothetical protein [Sticta canariensis]